MIRYDIYEQQLNPGDYICCVLKGELVAARIFAISVKGTLLIKVWNPEFETYSRTVRMRGYKIIKTAGMPVLSKPAQIDKLSSDSTQLLG